MAGPMDKGMLLAQVKKMNDKSEAARASKRSATLDKLYATKNEIELSREALIRLRQERGSPDYVATKAHKEKLELELQQLQFELDPAYEFAQADAAISAAQAEAEAKKLADTHNFSNLAKMFDDRLHKKTGWAVHPKAYDGNTREVIDVISRGTTNLGPSDLSLLAQPWTRFDYKPSVTWRVPRPEDGLAKIAAAQRAVDEVERMRQVQMEAHAAKKPALDLSFGVESSPDASAPRKVSSKRGGGGASTGTDTQAAKSGHKGEAALANSVSPRSTLRGTQGGATRTTALPDIPSATVNSRLFTLTQQAVPQELLGTLSPEQLKKPRHPAYLLDSVVHHPKRWLKGDKDSRAFSVPPRERSEGFIDARATERFIAPERNYYHPKAMDGKEEWKGPDSGVPPLFSHVPLDSDWIKIDDVRKAAELEANFYKVAQASYEGEDAFEGEGGRDGAPGGGNQTPQTSAFTVSMVGEPSLGYAAAQRYTTRKAEVTAAMRPPQLGYKVLDSMRAQEQAKLGALAARIGTARGGTGHTVWSKDDGAVGRMGKKLGF